MPNTSWTIDKETGGKDKGELDGLQIVQTETGFNLQKGDDVLDSQPFVAFSYTDGNNISWEVVLNTLGDKPGGIWTNNDSSIEGEEGGEWTAQAGTGVPDPKKASSTTA